MTTEEKRQELERINKKLISGKELTQEEWDTLKAARLKSETLGYEVIYRAKPLTKKEEEDLRKQKEEDDNSDYVPY